MASPEEKGFLELRVRSNICLEVRVDHDHSKMLNESPYETQNSLFVALENVCEHA